jgi:hypothetical protein
MIATTPSNTSPLLNRKSMMYAISPPPVRGLRLSGEWRGEEGKGDTADKLSPVHCSMTLFARSSSDCGIVRPRALAGLHVYDQLELLRLLDGQVGGLGALENPPDEARETAGGRGLEARARRST